jgi:hypothetical protein
LLSLVVEQVVVVLTRTPLEVVVAAQVDIEHPQELLVAVRLPKLH